MGQFIRNLEYVPLGEREDQMVVLSFRNHLSEPPAQLVPLEVH